MASQVLARSGVRTSEYVRRSAADHRPGRVLLGAVTLMVLAACAGRGSRLGGRDEPVVREIRIEGADRVSEDFIRRRLATEETGSFPWSERTPFDPVVWQQDLRRIPRIYESEGYYGARVVDASVDERKDGVYLSARVEEPPATRIRTLELTGLEDVPEHVQLQLEGAVRLHEGERFREGDWESSKRELEQRLRAHGYAEAQAGGAARVDLLHHGVDVKLEVAPGQRYKLGALYLAAVPPFTLPAERILAFARDELPERDWFSQPALAATQQRLFELGVFDAVSVTAAAPEPGDDRLPIVVEVRQAPTSALRLGGGVGLEPGRHEARAVAEWTDRNFFGALRSLRIAGSGGWAAVPGVGHLVFDDDDREVTRDGPFAEVYADLSQPRFLGIGRAQGFATVELEQDFDPGYAYRSARTEVGIGYHLSERLDAQASVAFDVYGFYDSLLPRSGDPAATSGCGSTCRIAYLEQAITFGRRLRYRQAEDRLVTTLRLREGGNDLGADWIQALLDARTYLPLSQRLQLSGRIGAGTILAQSGVAVPIPLRHFSGGRQMRGFGARQLSPQLLVPTATPGIGAGVATGGRGLLDGSLELRWRLGQTLGLAGFVDVGAVTLEPFDPARLLDVLAIAPGVGIEYRTPLGPIRLDVAYRLAMRGDLQTLSRPGESLEPVDRPGCIGGGPGSLCAIHISIGEAF